MNNVCFSLTPHIYAAHFDNAVIILDSSTDKYLSFIDTAAQSLHYALDNTFKRAQPGKFVPIDSNHVDGIDDYEQLTYWINHFIENKIIQESPPERRKLIATCPIQAGGLIEYCWDHKPSWKPFAQTPKLHIIKAFFMLAKVHRMLKRKGIAGVLDAIKKVSANHTHVRQPTAHEIETLAAAVDAASLLYPKKTYCLTWASTFTLLALKKGWPCTLAIGIQVNPFYAHAWAEISGNVIHDDPAIAQVLSIILKEPTI